LIEFPRSINSNETGAVSVRQTASDSRNGHLTRTFSMHTLFALDPVPYDLRDGAEHSVIWSSMMQIHERAK
jgi:hypothetical protein